MKDKHNLLILDALSFFVENPYEKIHLREFARRMNISVNSAQRFLNLFLKEGFIKEERVANLRYFTANLDSIVFRNIKITFSLKEIDNSGLIKFLGQSFPQVVLYGSVAKGLNSKSSDVDVVCIGKGSKPEVYSFEKKLSREINLQVFNFDKWNSIKKQNKAFYQDVISTGINLIGEIPV